MARGHGFRSVLPAMNERCKHDLLAGQCSLCPASSPHPTGQVTNEEFMEWLRRLRELRELSPLPAARRPPEPPTRGERRFHGQPGHFPPAAVNHPARRSKGPELLARGRGSWLSEAWGRSGLGESAPAPLRQDAAHEVFTSRGGRSECIGAVRLSNPEDVLVGCADGFERVNVLFVDVVRGPQNMHDGHVARPGDARSRSTRVTH